MPKSLKSEIVHLIATDIVTHRRGYLYGNAEAIEDEIKRRMERSILVDNIDHETVCLMLSTLPSVAGDLFLSELDKGLSGSQVFAARCTLPNGTKSKAYVFKIGEINKIVDEANRVSEIVVPTLRAIHVPVLRIGKTRALLSQEFAGIAATASLRSLRDRVRADDSGPMLVRQLLHDRLNVWYQPDDLELEDRLLGEIFKRHISKYRRQGPEDSVAEWTELYDWVSATTGDPPRQIDELVETLEREHVRTPVTISHGDLHTQNVLVDSNNLCWPIDFAWTTIESSPLVDLAMLESSLKFLVLPRRSDLRSLFQFEQQLCVEGAELNVGKVPYCNEIRRVYNTVAAVREFAVSYLSVSHNDYLKALLLLTCTLSKHPQLNRPYVIASTQLIAAALGC